MNQKYYNVLLITLFTSYGYGSSVFNKCADSLMSSPLTPDELELDVLAFTKSLMPDMPSHLTSILGEETSLTSHNMLSRNMLARASLMAYVFESPSVTIDHILLAALTQVRSHNRQINQLNNIIFIKMSSYVSLGLSAKDFSALNVLHFAL